MTGHGKTTTKANSASDDNAPIGSKRKGKMCTLSRLMRNMQKLITQARRL
jgi:hypothetical protein